MTDLYTGHGWQLKLEKAALPDGRTKEDVRIYRSDSVHVLALSDPNHVVVIREYRPFWGTWVWMLPSGKLDKETDILEGAQRELREEAGYRAEKLQHLWSVNFSEAIDITHHIVLAEGLTPDPLPQDEDELIEVHTLTFEEALKNIESSEKVHATGAYALRRYLNS